MTDTSIRKDPHALTMTITAEKRTVRPYGLWSSPITPKSLAQSLRLNDVAWDSDGRWTGFRQTVKAVTSTVEYRIPNRRVNAILRLEHRWDDSRGRGGGFFRGGYTAPGVVGLTSGQHLLVFGTIFTFDSTFRR